MIYDSGQVSLEHLLLSWYPSLSKLSLLICSPCTLNLRPEPPTEPLHPAGLCSKAIDSGWRVVSGRVVRRVYSDPEILADVRISAADNTGVFRFNTARVRAKRDHFERFERRWPQGQNLASTISYVPLSLEGRPLPTSTPANPPLHGVGGE